MNREEIQTQEARTTLYATLEHLWDVAGRHLEPQETSELQRDIDRAVDLLVEAARTEGKFANWNKRARTNWDTARSAATS